MCNKIFEYPLLLKPGTVSILYEPQNVHYKLTWLSLLTKSLILLKKERKDSTLSNECKTTFLWLSYLKASSRRSYVLWLPVIEFLELLNTLLKFRSVWHIVPASWPPLSYKCVPCECMMRTGEEVEEEKKERKEGGKEGGKEKKKNMVWGEKGEGD